MIPSPEVSVVIPVYDEQAILYDAVAGLLERLAARGVSFEVVLAENGSRDGTLDVARELESRHPEVRHLSLPEPNYGKALKRGILAAHGAIVVADEIDLLDVDFHVEAVARVRAGADLVIGSKLMAGARDQRPLFRHLGSLVYTGLLRAAVGYSGTDTHGPKALDRARLLPIVEACRLDRDVFASELAVRAARAGLSVVELPLTIQEKRPPSVNLLRRVPAVLKNLAQLAYFTRRGSPHLDPPTALAGEPGQAAVGPDGDRSRDGLEQR
ncbi:MAG: glycosyltransferase family 2 protein [Myxococcota bacterium]|nr:glycosyltransferase family 2 protein [Myxococcota bacterium]